MDYARHTDDAELLPGPGGAHALARLFDAGSGCLVFDQRVIRIPAGSSSRFVDERSDEVLYVLAGRGTCDLGGTAAELAPEVAAFVPAGTVWGVEAADDLEVLSVLVHDPIPSGDTGCAVLDLAQRDAGGATAGRQFRLLATPECGCASVTQFVGYIPVGRAPDHFHKYDEVVYVIAGTGALHIGGETAQLRQGSAVHLPARLVHCLENVGPGEMLVLGVFRPAGSPAEAYYPDGTAAVVPTKE
jgi:quercetin dioxygenase-like cupin family protein